MEERCVYYYKVLCCGEMCAVATSYTVCLSPMCLVQDEGQQTSEEKDDINVDECAVDESQKQQEEDENKKGENGFAPQVS